MVAKTRELLPEPETPVNTVSRRFGISMLMFLRLFSRAPCTRMRSCESAARTASAAPGQLGDLDQVAAGVLQHGDLGRGHVGWRHGELGAAGFGLLVIGLDIVRVEHLGGLAL